MRVLFITQKIDQNDDVLGVYHRWISELAFKVDSISAICLFRGAVDLPSNVRVYSLGKEEKLGKWAYLKNLFRYIWHLRDSYDVVFVHMNPEYVILGGLLWKILGKKIVLWYAHYLSNWRIKLAAALADRIVTSYSLAFPFPSKKLEILQQGIDTKLFNPVKTYRTKSEELRILFLGRIAPVKNLDVLIKAIQLVSQSLPVKLSVVGAPTAGRPAEVEYLNYNKKLAADMGLSGLISFNDPVPNKDTPPVYRKHDLFINLTVTGSFDKSTLEAMACGLPVLVSNRAFEEILGSHLASQLMFAEGDHRELAEKIVRFAAMPVEKRREIGKQLRSITVEKHDLSVLISRLAGSLRQTLIQ